jgi:hypothetical protein
MGDGQTYAWLVEMGKGGIRYALEEDEATIGRGAACEIRLSDPKVSRSHARIFLESGQVILEDLKSAHGVLVNGQKIGKVQLADGDKIQLGNTHLVLEIVQDAIGTIMAPSIEQALDEQPCRYCQSPITQGEAYCSTCGSLTRALPEPFGFIQQAYLQLRALHQSGKMDATTFRTELEKMVIADGSGGYWMVGVQSGRWHWFNGSEWIQREPPSTPLKQAPLVEPQAPPLPPPVAPPPDPGVMEVDEGGRSRRLFLIGGGTLIAFSILAIGAYAAYQLINAGDEAPAAATEIQPPPVSAITEPESTQTVSEGLIEPLSNTPTFAPESLPTEAPSLLYSIRPYDPGTDETLGKLADFAKFMEAQSSPEHAIYEGSWNVQQPAIFSIGWCAIDEATLSQNLQVIQMDLAIDGRIVEPESMFEEAFVDTNLACKSSRIVLEFLEPGEHRLQWTTSYSEPVFDGWDTLEAGTYLNDYVFEVKTATKIEDEFNESSGRWDEGVQGNFSLWTEGGGFHIQVHKENFAAWSIYHDLAVSDALVITHAKRISEVEGAYGLITRYQDVSNFYYFIVDDAGYFTLGKRLAGEYIDLIGWTASEAILSGDDVNSLGITISGNEIVAFINSQVVGIVSDDSFQAGHVGMLAQSVPEMGEMHAVFDVFYIEYYE